MCALEQHVTNYLKVVIFLPRISNHPDISNDSKWQGVSKVQIQATTPSRQIGPKDGNPTVSVQ